MGAMAPFFKGFRLVHVPTTFRVNYFSSVMVINIKPLVQPVFSHTDRNRYFNPAGLFLVRVPNLGFQDFPQKLRSFLVRNGGADLRRPKILGPERPSHRRSCIHGYPSPDKIFLFPPLFPHNATK